MKKFLSALLLLLVLAPAGAMLESCQDGELPCRGVKSPQFYDLKGLSLVAVRLATGAVIVANEAVATNEIRLEIKPQVTYYGYWPARKSWLSAAFACPPARPPGYDGTTEILDSLVVRSIYAYDAGHPAGALLNDLLLDSETRQALLPTPAANTRPSAYGPWLQFRQGPAQAGPQQFVVRYRLTNGEVYTARTPVFTLR